ncbi:hypothetical protein PLESTB_001172300 [Pleodorina starrii]|uniref:Methyltransferase domain-containing protein n=1 Tax=Pleodorina starrii TaxID=330485 RepID=A0A9W6BS02_9CHLO|nr:hypothetical protein PLESTM_000248200 [Pleodorina starrii]GLC57003.1 hypothetical protein PLESTB_001172300 [Pleodorina starrii]GLC64835.1 hypothetical protein PLESTF_000212500 [Pleodorina starrii]
MAPTRDEKCTHMFSQRNATRQRFQRTNHIRTISNTIYILLMYASLIGLASADVPLRVLPRQAGEWGNWAYRNLSTWRSTIFGRTQQFIVSKNNSEYPPAWERFDLFQPFISCPPGRTLRRVGQGDGGKWLCDPSTLNAPCTIISLGSGMEFTFERGILADTPCKVLTADCTVTGSILSERHTFLPLCVGSAAAAQRSNQFTTYEALVTRAQVEAVPVLKIDVEAFEYPVFAEWHEHTAALPEQIAVEVHWGEGDTPFNEPGPEFKPQWGRGSLSVSDLSLFFFHLANLGYGIINQERNLNCDQCSEFTLLRVESVPRNGRTLRRFAP